MKGYTMGILQLAKDIEHLNNKLRQALGIKVIDVTYIDASYNIVVKRGNNNE